MGDVIRLWHRGRLVEVDDAPSTETVLAWLRRERISMGTKEGCNEGDCGACTVVVGDVAGDGTLSLRTAHACLLLVPMLHGRALITVEDLAQGGVLHPVQQALVDHFGSQCGYCTPGIVMSLWHLREGAVRQGHVLTAEDVRTALAGHVCRCTGYRSIVEAGRASMARRSAPFDAEPVLAALAGIPADEVLDYCVGGRFHAPVSVEGLIAARDAWPQATVIAGGTDLLPALPPGGDLAPDLIWTGRVRGFADVDEAEGILRIGAGATVESAWGALACRWPALTEGWRRFASPAVRGAGTIGGNLVTGSPVGDTAPVLLALDARLLLRSAHRERWVPMSDFATGYRRTAVAPDELLVQVDIPAPVPDGDVRMFKVARRFDNDIATVSMATFLRREGDGRIVEVRVAFGGVAESAVRAPAVEAALLGRDWDHDTVEAAACALAIDCRPISDHRGSAAFRLRLARGLLERWWLLTRSDHPVPLHDVDVWSAS